jgi:hypothetical protein
MSFLLAFPPESYMHSSSTYLCYMPCWTVISFSNRIFLNAIDYYVNFARKPLVFTVRIYSVILIMIASNLIGRCQRFGESYCLQFQETEHSSEILYPPTKLHGVIIQNISWPILRHYLATHTKRRVNTKKKIPSIRITGIHAGIQTQYTLIHLQILRVICYS